MGLRLNGALGVEIVQIMVEQLLHGNLVFHGREARTHDYDSHGVHGQNFLNQLLVFLDHTEESVAVSHVGHAGLLFLCRLTSTCTEFGIEYLDDFAAGERNWECGSTYYRPLWPIVDWSFDSIRLVVRVVDQVC